MRPSAVLLLVGVAACAATSLGQPVGGPVGEPADPGLGAPVDEDVSAYEGRPIRQILLRRPASSEAPEGPEGGGPVFAEVDGSDAQRALNNIRTIAGSAYREELILADVARLNRLNAFARVDTFVQLVADGSVDVYFVLEPQKLIADVQVTGNRRINDQKIAGEIDVLVGTPIDRFQIERAARRIENVYRERGFFNAEVTIDEQQLVENNIVLFRVREGDRVKITDIRFPGADSFTRGQLLREVESVRAGLFRRGTIDELRLDSDVGSLVEFYKDRGHLDVRVDFELQPSPDGREAILNFIVQEGAVYTFRELIVEYVGSEAPGYDRVFEPAQILGLMSLKPGDVYGAKAIDASVQTIDLAYGKLGHTDVLVRRFDQRDTERPEVDMVLQITPGPRYLVGEVITTGNDITQTRVLLREAELKPGRPLDADRLAATERNLRRVQLFNPRRLELTLQRPDPTDPRYRDVLIEIEETNTGSLDLGGAVNSDAGLIGRLALTQRNFSINDTPESLGELFSGRAFRGGGQTFNIELAPGERVETYSVSLSDPALLDTDFSGSAALFFRNRDFDEFDEERFGGRFGLGRRFGTRWSGNLSLRTERVRLGDISPFRPTDIFELEGEQNTIIGIGPSLTRTTYDDLFLPTRGSRTELSHEFVTGDFNFNRFSAEHTFFIPLREDFFGRTTALSFRGRVGYIPEDRADVPTFERFYLGGQSFRGFEFRTISPRGNRAIDGLPSDDPIGGTWLVFAGAEIRQPVLTELLAVAAFIDSGTVTFDPGFEDYRVSVGVGIRISVPQLSPAPLAFDFGFPIAQEETDEERLFTFSIDLPF